MSNGNLDEADFRRALRSAAIELDDLSFVSLVSTVGKDFRGFVDWRKFLRRYHDARLHGPCDALNATGTSTGLLNFGGTGYGKLGDAGDIAATTSPEKALSKSESAPAMSAYILRDTKPSHRKPRADRGATTSNGIYRTSGLYGRNEENDANGANYGEMPSPEQQPDLTFITSIKSAEEFAKNRSAARMERATIGYDSRGTQSKARAQQGGGGFTAPTNSRAKGRPGSAVQSRRSAQNIHNRISDRVNSRPLSSGGWNGPRPTTS
jgi:hypothetical protein